jgi:hypothetical protein
MTFDVKPISETKRLLACTEQEAHRNLEAAARRLLKEAHPYRSKIRELQKPLLQLRMAKRQNRPSQQQMVSRLGLWESP